MNKLLCHGFTCHHICTECPRYKDNYKKDVDGFIEESCEGCEKNLKFHKKKYIRRKTNENNTRD